MKNLMKVFQIGLGFPESPWQSFGKTKSKAGPQRLSFALEDWTAGSSQEHCIAAKRGAEDGRKAKLYSIKRIVCKSMLKSLYVCVCIYFDLCFAHKFWRRTGGTCVDLWHCIGGIWVNLWHCNHRLHLNH